MENLLGGLSNSTGITDIGRSVNGKSPDETSFLGGTCDCSTSGVVEAPYPSCSWIASKGLLDRLLKFGNDGIWDTLLAAFTKDR